MAESWAGAAMAELAESWASMAMVAPDGWRVEVIKLDERCWYKVTHHGYTAGGISPLAKHGGLIDTWQGVAAVMGEAFAQLVEESDVRPARH